MTKEDVQRIFDCVEEINLGNGVTVKIKDFLTVAGFEQAPGNPTKEDLHALDEGKKGYADLIEQGNYEY